MFSPVGTPLVHLLQVFACPAHPQHGSCRDDVELLESSREAAPCQTQSVLLWCCCEAEQSPHTMPGSAGTALPSLLAHVLVLPLAPRDTRACGGATQSNI